MKLKIAACLFLLFCLLLLLSKPALAARSLTITANKSSLFGDEEMTINASTSGFVDGETIYVKGAFYQEGSTNYFGLTKNVDSWIKNGQTTTSQRQVKVGEWDNVLLTKSDFSDSGYKGEGDYKFKAGFYYTTSGSNLSSVNWSNILSVVLNEPDPTPTPTLTPTSTPTPAPTNTPTPTKTPQTPTPSLSPTPSSTPTAILEKTPTPNTKEFILGETTSIGSSESSPTPTSPTLTAGFFEQNIAKMLIIGGGFFLVVAAGLFWKSFRKNLFEKQDGSDNED